jgi:hypothetical protein
VLFDEISRLKNDVAPKGEIPDDRAFVVGLEVDIFQFPEVKQTFLEALLLSCRQHVSCLLKKKLKS